MALRRSLLRRIVCSSSESPRSYTSLWNPSAERYASRRSGSWMSHDRKLVSGRCGSILSPLGHDGPTVRLALFRSQESDESAE
jgi:hypothetical protein